MKIIVLLCMMTGFFAIGSEPGLVDTPTIPEDTVTIDGGGDFTSSGSCPEAERFPNCTYSSSTCKANCKHAKDHNYKECDKNVLSYTRYMCKLQADSVYNACLAACT